MSGPRLSIIPARAATDRALKPRDLQVLCVLGRHTNDLGWCRKSQVKMADEMGCARSTVFEAIERLVKAGYLERHEQVEKNGRDSPHIYRVILDPRHPDLSAVKDSDDHVENTAEIPCRLADTPAGISAPPAGPEPAPPAGPEPAPKNDPFRTAPQNEGERERAREAEEEGENRKAVERAFERAYRAWPTSISDSRPAALDAWLGLTPAERETAAIEAARYVEASKAAGRKHVVSHAVYLREKRWEQLPPAPPEPAKPAYAPALGPVWAAIRMRDFLTGAKHTVPLKAWEMAAIDNGTLDRASLEKGNRMRGGWPAVNAMHAAAETRGHGVTGHGEAEEQLGKLCEFVPIGTERWTEWKVEHELRGWPWLPDPGRMGGAYFPASGPGALSAFEQAVKQGNEGNTDDGGQRQAAE